MHERLQDIHEELEDQLSYLFGMIVSEESENLGGEDQYHIKYRKRSEVYNRRETGTVIIGSENDEEVSYAYRLIFDDSENKPDRNYWYSSDYGLKSVSVLLGERYYIVDCVLRDCSRRTDIISQEDVDYIDKLFEELEERKRTIRESYDMEDVKEFLLENRRSPVQDIIAPDNESSVELWKLLFSRDSDGQVVENNVDIMLKNNNTLLARTDRVYHGSQGSREYPFGLMIERDRWTNEFYVHRLKRNKMLEDPEYSWSIEDLNRSLGYEVHLLDKKNKKVGTDKTTRLCPNIVAVPLEFNSEFRKYRNYIHERLEEGIRYLYTNYYKQRRNVDLNSYKASISRRDGLKTHSDLTTDELKDLGRELGISEHKIRIVQERRNIGRLSTNLRLEILNDMFGQKILDWIFKQSSQEIRKYQVDYEDEKGTEFGRHIPASVMSISGTMAKEAIKEPSSTDIRSVYNLSSKIAKDNFTDELGNVKVERNGHLFTFRDSKRHPRRIQVSEYGIDKIETIVVPNESEILHECSGNSGLIPIDRGVYVLKDMKSTRTRHF